MDRRPICKFPSSNDTSTTHTASLTNSDRKTAGINKEGILITFFTIGLSFVLFRAQKSQS